MQEAKKFYTMVIPEFEKKREEWLMVLSKTKESGMIKLELEFIPNEPNTLNLQTQTVTIIQGINFHSCRFGSRNEVVDNRFGRLLETARLKHLELENGAK